MSILDTIKNLFGNKVTETATGTVENLKEKADDMIDTAADMVKDHTPEMMDGMVDAAADHAKEALQDVSADEVVNTVEEAIN